MIGVAMNLRPVFQLDVALKPEQLSDPELKRSTQEMLHRLHASDNGAILLTLAGTAVVLTSGLGFVCSSWAGQMNAGSASTNEP